MSLRYEVFEVFRDGVPRMIRAFDSLDLALDCRDELDKENGNRIAPFYGVSDSHDEERGWLDWDDTEVAA